MKNIGIVRKLDELGRITLPKEMRRSINLQEGEPVEIYVDNDTICLKPVPKKSCVICGTTEQLFEVEGLHICQKCGCKIIDKLTED